MTGALVTGCTDPAPKTATPAPAPTPAPVETRARAVTLAGFSDTVVLSGRTNPIAVRFASNGKVFIAEENGRIYFHDNLSDSTATLFVDLRSEVNSYWDRGLLGFTLDPNYATNGYMYALYTHDTATNSENNQSIANRNGTDNCPSPPGGTSQGCVTYGRLVRLRDPGSGYPISITGPDKVNLITEWPQQFPSHAIGGLAFGPDGMLYATSGDGASFGAQDWGNFGIPKNPLGDPPAGVGGTMTSPTSRGGSLRSQSFRRPSGENVVLNGTVIRIDPNNGTGATGNPNLSHPDVDGKRIIAIGLRNPYRFTFHPTTGDIWIADVGGNSYEEINRLPAPLTATPMKNFGWPCYEGSPAFSNWSGFNLCSSLSPSSHTPPYYAYAHDAPIISGDQCGPTGSSAITGIAFYPSSGGNYPAEYRNAMFFSDLPRNCIWVVSPGTNGLPNMSTRRNFIVDASHPVDLQIGPNNDLFYVDYGGTGGTTTNNGTGTVRRIRFQAPVAVATANPTSGNTPLTVQFNGSMSTPGQTGLTLSYAWDLDGDGQYDDSTAQNPSRTYTTPGTINVRLRVTDSTGSNESQPLAIVVGSTTTPPVPVMDTPLASLTWKVGDQISFSGSATDEEDGPIPASGLNWQLIVLHCPNTCHEHLIETFPGVASGSFPAPDHEYPSYLQLRLTATDSHGVSTTISRDLQPQTVTLSFNTMPTASPGLELALNLASFAAPFTQTVIKGSGNTIIANNQTRGNTLYTFASWSDGGLQAHNITADTDLSFTANFTTSLQPWTSADIGAVAAAGSWSESGGVHTIAGNGADIWTANDEFRYTYQQLSGDGSITARVNSFTNAGNANGKAGVMIRQNLNANSPHVMAAMPPQGTTTAVKQIKRVTAGATSTSETGAAPSFPAWVRIVRSGTTFTSYHSTNGTTFTQLGAATTISTMSGAVYVGLAVTSHVDGANSTAVFDNVSITTPAPPQAPSGLVASGGVNQATLNWTDNATNESGYKIERKLASDPDTAFAQVGTAGVNATSFINTGVAPGVYSYRVKANNANGDSAPSNSANATVTAPTPPNPPSLLTGNGGVSQATLQWTDNATDETGFKIERKPQGDPDSSFAQVGTVGANATTFTNTGVAGGVYTYRVRATNGVGDSGYSNTTDVTITDPPPPAAPSNLQAQGGVAQVVLTWTDNANNETGFEIDRKLQSDPDTSFAQVGTAAANVTTFTNTGVPGGVYSYRVRATNAVGDSGNSNTAEATVTDPTPPLAPTGLAANGGAGQASLSWTDNASDETSYKIERKLAADPDTSFAQVGTAAANATTFTNTSVPAGSYSYRVRAANAVGDSGYSNVANATVTAPPVNPWTSSDIGAVAAAGSWSESGGVHTIVANGADIWNAADEFRFTYQQLPGDGSITARVNSLSNAGNANGKAGVMFRQNLTAGSPHLMAAMPPGGTTTPVRNIKRLTAGATSTSETGAAPSFPAWVRIVRAGTTFTAYHSTDGTTFTQLGTPTTIATMTGTIYVGLAVTSHVDGVNVTGVFDNVTVAGAPPPTAPAAPSGLGASGGAGQATLAWTDNADNETGFKIERKLATDPDSAYVQIGTAATNATGFTNTGLAAGSYSYRVRATNAVGDSAYSNSANATVTTPSGPAAPTNLNATTATGNSAILTWTDNANNETGFRVERKVGTGAFTSLATKAANVVTHTDSGLAAGTYTYRVIATGSPDSAPTNEVVVVIATTVADAYVREGTNAGNNYGTETYVKVKLNSTVANNRRGYVRFPLTGVAATVSSAKVRLYGVATTTTKQVGLHAVANTTWGETTITFSNAPAMTTPAIQTVGVTTTAGYVEWDVTSHVQAQRTAGATAVSFGLLTTTFAPDAETNFNSKENAANKPVLIISSK